jgi:hypothetical protein
VFIGIFLKGLRKTSLNIAVVPIEFRKDYLSNSVLEGYRYAKPLGIFLLDLVTLILSGEDYTAYIFML